MKRSLILSVCIVLGSALVANAEAVTGASWLNYTRTPGTYGGVACDRIEFNLTTTGWPTSDKLTSVEGTWSATKGSLYLATNVYDTGDLVLGWQDQTKLVTPAVLPLSYVNFDTTNGSATWARSSDADTTNWSSFLEGSWFTTTATKYLDPSGSATLQRLARMYVTTGADISFAGQFNYLGAGGTGVPTSFSTAATPEPGTLVLLATGLIGLVAYGWRKRK